MADEPIRMSIANCRSAVPCNHEVANYSLIELNVAQKANLGDVRAEMVLVLDRSGSMNSSASDGTRHISRVIDAVEEVVKALRPNDRLAIVAFDDQAQLYCPLTAGETRKQLLDAVRELRHDCGPGSGGGTSMHPALKTAVEEIRRNARDARAARLVILTDGQAGDPNDTLAYVTTLERQSIAALGFGDFDFDFMNKVCAPSKGLCQEVGAQSPSKVKDVFMSELHVAQDTAASNLRLRIRPTTFVRLRKAYVVHPHTTYLGPVEMGRNREYTIDLPVLERSEGIQVMFDLQHLPRDPGECSAAEVSVLYDMSSLGVRDREIVGNIMVEYTNDEMKIRGTDQRVMSAHNRAYDEECRMNLEQAEKDGDSQRADQILKTLRRSDNPEVVAIATRRQEAGGGGDAQDAKTLQLATRRKMVSN
jgi:Ca-activated chloride channel homolog